MVEVWRGGFGRVGMCVVVKLDWFVGNGSVGGMRKNRSNW